MSPRSRRASKVALFFVLFTAVLALWIASLRLFYRPSQDALRPSDGALSSYARPLLQRQLNVWADRDARTRELRRMRASNPEWDLMARTYLVLALANVALREARDRDAYVRAMDWLIDDTIAREREHGQGYFLLGYSRARPWINADQRSLFVDGELALMAAARRVVRDDREDLRSQLATRAAQIEAQMSAGPIASAESYPDECWTFCNTVALAALRVREVLDGVDHSAIVQRWLAQARARLVDGETGLLVSSYTMDGAVREGPEGSSIFMVAHDLQVIDRAFAEDQYRRAKRELLREWLGFGFAREWPASSSRSADVDSGPTIPWVGANAGASGLAVLGAGSFDDRAALAGLVASLELAAFPVSEGGSRRFLASNAVGDAVLLYALVEGPLWREVDARRAARAGGAR
ncbi:MAG: hypothetical protein U0269_15190 [Polyangiales bacterium]